MAVWLDDDLMGCPMCIRDGLALLTHPQSITQYLRQRKNDVTVECFRVLVDAEGTRYRDIQICANGRIQWCARTLIPSNTYAQLKKYFDWNGDRPLGDFIFTSTNVYRSTIHLTFMNKFPDWVRERIPQQQGGFVRHSTWILDKDFPLTISEYFAL
jgi:chorismate-pyruvate lyase